MWRYFVGAAGALMLAAAGLFLFRGSAQEEPVTPPPPPAQLAAATSDVQAEPPKAPRASDRTREEKRFDRYDRDRNEAITREEYLRSRRTAFAKLDTNGDGKLSFEEWAVRTTAKFAKADADRSKTLSRKEFATTAVVRKTPSKPKCACPPAPRRGEGDDGED